MFDLSLTEKLNQNIDALHVILSNQMLSWMRMPCLLEPLATN